jgi:hypothetical protein
VAAVSLFLLQAASALVSPAPASDERLLHPVPSATCHPSANEIVVCAKDVDTYRLPKPGPPPDIKGPPKAEWGLFGDAKMNVHGSQRSIGGIPAPAAMVTVTIPF